MDGLPFVAFFSPGDITELRPIEPSLARVRVEKSGSLQVQGSRRRASAAARSSPPCSRLARRLVPSQTSRPWLRTRTLIVAPRCSSAPVSYTHLRAHETDSYLVC